MSENSRLHTYPPRDQDSEVGHWDYHLRNAFKDIIHGLCEKKAPKPAKMFHWAPGLWSCMLAERLRSGEYLQPFTSVTSTSGWNQALILDKGDNLELH